MTTIHDTVPDVPGVYTISNQDGTLVYVGQTSALNKIRWQNITMLRAGNHFNVDVQRMYDRDPNLLFNYTRTPTKAAARELKEKTIAKLGSKAVNKVATNINNSGKKQIVSEETKKRKSLMNKGHSCNGKAVCIEGVVYNSVKEAGVAFGISAYFVRKRIMSDDYPDWKMSTTVRPRAKRRTTAEAELIYQARLKMEREKQK